MTSASLPARTRGIAFVLLVACCGPCSVCCGQFAFNNQQDIVAMYFFRGNDEASFRRGLEARVNLRYARLKSLVDLGAAQQKKIELALMGDINRFYRELDDVREKTKGLNMNNQAEMQKAWTILSPLYSRYMSSGIIGDDSLYERVVLVTLTEQQSEIYKQYLVKRRERLARAIILSALSELEKSIPLLDEQREKMLELLEQEPLPQNLQMNEAMAMAVDGSSILKRLDKEQVAEFLDENQMAAFEKFRGQQNMIGGFF